MSLVVTIVVLRGFFFLIYNNILNNSGTFIANCVCVFSFIHIILI